MELSDLQDDFSAFYHREASSLKSFSKKMREICEAVAVESGAITTSCRYRIKALDSCLDKIEKKEYHLRHGESTPIERLLSDVVGIRILCLYEDDVQRVADAIAAALHCEKREDKTSQINKSLEFGYKGIHLDVRMNDERLAQSEYNFCKGFFAEVQVRTVSQDAWSEVDHKIKYKNTLSHELTRRILRLAALFEVADQEFKQIRDVMKKERDDSLAELKKDENQSTEVNVTEAISLLEEKFPSYTFDEDRVENILEECRAVKQPITLGDFKLALETHLGVINQFYLKRLAPNNIRMNPLTKLRHVIFLSNKDAYDSLLNPAQKGGILKFVDEKNKK